MLSFNNLFAAYPEYRNTTQQWLTSDTEQLYLENYKTPAGHRKLKDGEWEPGSVEYKFNSQGFRSEEFTTEDDSIVFLGCSYTVGIGNRYEETFPYIIASATGLQNYNLGVGGGSNDAAFRLGSYWIPRLLPKAVVLVAPSKLRCEVIDRNTVEFFGVHAKMKKNLIGYQRAFLSNDVNMSLNKQKNILGLRHLCNDLGIPILVSDESEIEQVDLARDLAHGGPETNKLFAERLKLELRSILK